MADFVINREKFANQFGKALEVEDPKAAPTQPADSEEASESEDQSQSEEDSDQDDDFDFEDELRPLRYPDECPALPVNRPVGYPHLVHVKDWDESIKKTDLRCADGVATLLWHYNREHFKSFFDMSNPKYELSRTSDRGIG